MSDRELLREAAELQQRWDAALAAAVQNREAAQNERAADSKKAAEASGVVQYSIADVEESFDIRSNNDYIGVQKSVLQVLKNEGFFQGGTNIAKTADKTLIVEITERGIRETLGTGKRFQYLSRKKKQLKLATIRELPKIIQTATVVTDNAENYHKENSKVQYAYLKSQANIDGTDYLITVTVRKSQQKNLFWIHEVRTDEMKQANVSSEAMPQREYKKTPVSDGNIAQSETDVKPQHSEWDGGMSDRELLREAAELQQRWDAALAAAVQNREAVQNERAADSKKPPKPAARCSIQLRQLRTERNM